MSSEIPQASLAHQPGSGDAPEGRVFTVLATDTSGALGYVFYVATSVLLLLIVAVLSGGPFAASGEYWEFAAIMCYVAWPVLAVGCVTSIFIYPFYAQAPKRRRAVLILGLNALGVVALAFSFLFGLATLFPAAWLSYARWVAP
jgi:hypothetical protein